MPTYHLPDEAHVPAAPPAARAVRREQQLQKNPPGNGAGSRGEPRVPRNSNGALALCKLPQYLYLNVGFLRRYQRGDWGMWDPGSPVPARAFAAGRHRCFLVSFHRLLQGLGKQEA